MQEDSEVLADWNYSPEEWREYVEYEKDVRSSEIPDFFKNAGYYIVAAAIVLMFIILLSGEMAAVFLVLLFLPGVLALAVGIHWLIRKGEASTMASHAGRVQIFTNGVSTNGLWFDWEFEGDRSRFLSATRTTTYMSTAKVNLLEFKCVVKIRVRGTDQTFDKKWRVPIPKGKENEADVVIQRLYYTRALFSGSADKFSAEPLGLSASMDFHGHDFTASTVCLKCGSSIEAVTHFNWECEKIKKYPN